MLITTLGIAMLVPAAADAALGIGEWQIFVASSAISAAAGISLVLATHGEMEGLGLRQMFLLTSMSWVAVCAFGALPLALSDHGLRYVDAFYEATSGLSTTGGTVIVGLDTMTPGILLWRALLNWLGGIGIIAMAIVALPFLRVGGMQLFRTESSDKSEKPFAQSRHLALAILAVYLALSLASALLFHLSGMRWFDAICHAMAAVSTGGFSTRDASLGAFPNLGTYWAATVSMISGALPLTYYVRVLQRGGRAMWDSQVWVFLAVLAVCIGAMTLWVEATQDMPFWTGLSHAAVNVTSIITATGFVSTDYSLWGGFAVTAFFSFYFIGGCTGSTSGSIKIFRWQILSMSIYNQFRQMIHPHRVVRLVYNEQVVGQDVIGSVVSFVFAYIASFALLSVALSALGLDFVTSVSAVAAALAGAGPGLGPIVGPAGTYAPLPDAAKWILSLAMLLGRLEIFTLLVIVLPDFWRD